MKERPIIFSGEMVRAILCGRKSQMRRIIKPQPDGERRPLSEWSLRLAAACHDHSPDPAKLAAHSARMEGRIFPFSTPTGGLMSPVCQYGQPGDKLWVRESCFTDDARRITLEITEVRVERLQEISEDDAKAEGVMMSWAAGQMRAGTWRQGYRLLWESINGPGSWEANSFVWVIEFKRAE